LASPGATAAATSPVMIDGTGCAWLAFHILEEAGAIA
jgi:hypothetical protein